MFCVKRQVFGRLQKAVNDEAEVTYRGKSANQRGQLLQFIRIPDTGSRSCGIRIRVGGRFSLFGGYAL